MESQFKVVFTGKLKPGVERATFLKDFSQHYQCSEEKAAELLDAGKEITMKRSVDRQSAEEHRGVMEGLGMVIRLEPLAEQNGNTPSPAAKPAAAETNPYQAPSAELHQPISDGEMTGPVSVPFGHGAQWLGSAFNNHFRTNALAWIIACVVWIFISMLLGIIPLINIVAGLVLGPIITGGLMLGARAQDNGEDFTIGHLFGGFKQNTGQLALVGILYFVGIILTVVLGSAVMGGSMAMLMPMGAADPESAQAMVTNPMVMLMPILVMFLLITPVLMAYWFAPALVVLDDLSALAAMKLSFTGCLKNILPLSIYGIIILVLMFVAAIPLFLGYLVLVPVIMASMYTAYRDIYHS